MPIERLRAWLGIGLLLLAAAVGGTAAGRVAANLHRPPTVQVIARVHPLPRGTTLNRMVTVGTLLEVIKQKKELPESQALSGSLLFCYRG